MRLSLSAKVRLLCLGLVLLMISAAVGLLLLRQAPQRERGLVAQDRQLAQILAGLRTPEGQLDFNTLASFVSGADKVRSGLVYALSLDDAGKLVQSALNPRLFAALHADYALLTQQGRQHVLARLAAGEVERQGLIKEYSLPVPGGLLRLGFDLQRLDAAGDAALLGDLLLLFGVLVLGVLLAVLMADRLTRPLRQLALAAQAVERGELQRPFAEPADGELGPLSRALGQLVRTSQELTRFQDLFSRCLGPQVAGRLTGEQNPLEMGVEERAVSAVSLSLCGFGSLCRRLGPRESMRLLNEYLPALLDALEAQGGAVIVLEAERVRAVWGAPQDAPDHELRAARAALAARDAVDQQARIHGAAGGSVLRLRAAVCSGRAAAGNAGSAQRLAYQVLGGAVDLAVNAELLARPGEVLLAETTYTKIKSRVEVQAVNPLILEELDEAIPLYRLDRL